MNLQGDRLLARPALAKDENAGIWIRRHEVDALAQILHLLAIANQLAVAVPSVVCDKFSRLVAPRLLSDAIRKIPNRLCIRLLVAVVSIGVHGGADQFMILRYRLGNLAALNRIRQDISDIDIEHMSNSLHERAVEQFAINFTHIEQRRDQALLFVAHGESAHPRHLGSLEGLQRRRKSLLVSTERQADEIDVFPAAPFEFKELRKPPLAHAHHVRQPVQRPQRHGGGGGILLPAPAGQDEIVHVLVFFFHAPDSIS